MQNYVVIEIAIDEMQNYVDEYGSVRVVEELCNYLDSRYGIGNPVTAQ
jgi:hypothetical protein